MISGTTTTLALTLSALAVGIGAGLAGVMDTFLHGETIPHLLIDPSQAPDVLQTVDNKQPAELDLKRTPEAQISLRSEPKTIADMKWLISQPPKTYSSNEHLIWTEKWTYLFREPQNHEEAAAFISSLAPGIIRDIGWSKLVEAMALANPSGAGAFLKEIDSVTERTRAAASITNALADKQSPFIAMMFAKAMQEPSLRQGSFQGVFASWARSAPHEAIRHMRENIASLPAASLMPVIHRWTELSIADATAWVESLPDEDKRNALMLQIISSWRQWQPEAFEDWLTQQAPDSWRDEVIVNHIKDSTRGRGEVRFKMAATLDDPALRLQHAPTLFTNWAADDPAAAATWLSQAQKQLDRDDAFIEKLEQAQVASTTMGWSHFRRGGGTIHMDDKNVVVHY